MLRLLRDGVLSIVDEDRELAMRKVYRDTHKRNLRPHQQVEQAQTEEYNRRNVVGCSHTIKVDEASGSDPRPQQPSLCVLVFTFLYHDTVDFCLKF